ncbi:Uncharacterized [Moorella glycerini]|uniref:DUF5666 domain-containing protein n=1 Tax=Neomoorella stamsii TaxID=1266720 RepID=A0A9X7J588_9FIRM|nr:MULTISPECIES: hypothetical protein [Moorella]PRR76279.1 hypothetical protein MOST_04400 [Moorella stamsii]CEP67153.1 Uncharacterized [Moorella glycerini]
MRKGILALIIAGAFIFGAAAGLGGGYYKYVAAPRKQAVEMAKKQQEEMNKMVRHGTLTAVEPDKLTLKVEKGGGDIGQVISLTTNEYTSIQVGMGFVNKPGEKADLTKWFKAGDTIDALVKDGQALALHREPRPGEQVQQGQVSDQQHPGPGQAAPAQGQKK